MYVCAADANVVVALVPCGPGDSLLLVVLALNL